MATCNCPTITYPNGGETITGRTLTVTWYSPTPHHPENIAVWYELLFTNDYETDKQNNWMQIASLPAQITSFDWTVPFGVRSDNCRLAIRCRDARGKRSDLAIIADDFKISGHALGRPVVITPVSEAVYRRYVPITLGNEVIGGSFTHHASYQIYYSSKSLGIDWTVVKEDLPFKSESFLFDAALLNPATDYEFKFTLTDREGGASDPVVINNVSILSLNYAYLDTEPPKGTVTIQPDPTCASGQFTNNRDLILRFQAFDETTDIVSVNMRQVAGDAVESENEQQFAEVQSFRLTGDDGAKTLEAQFRDVAGNVLDPNIASGQRVLGSFFNNNDQEITAFTVDGDDVWTAFSDGTDFTLYKNKDIAGTLDNEANVMTIFDGVPYIGTITTDEKGILVKFVDDAVMVVNEFDDAESVINSLEVFDDDLYIALRNGGLQKFDTTTFSTIDTFDTQIKAMGSSVDALFLFFENTENINLYDGSTIQAVSVLNGS